MRQLDNFHARLSTRSAWVLVPTVLAMFALAGVTVPTAFDARAREAEVVAARADVQRLRDDRDRVEAFQQQGGFDELEGALAEARGALPFELSVMEAFSVMRLVARDADVELETLNVGEVVDLGLGSGADRVALRRLSLSGRATRANLMICLATLRSFGYPHAVLEGHLAQSAAQMDRFRFQLELGLFYFADEANAAPIESTGGAR